MKIGNYCIIPGHVKIGMDSKVYDVLYDIIDIKEEGNQLFPRKCTGGYIMNQLQKHI